MMEELTIEEDPMDSSYNHLSYDNRSENGTITTISHSTIINDSTIEAVHYSSNMTRQQQQSEEPTYSDYQSHHSSIVHNINPTTMIHMNNIANNTNNTNNTNNNFSPISIINWIQQKLNLNSNNSHAKSHLPPEVCSNIFVHVDYETLFFSVRLVCRRWKEIIEEELMFGPISILYEILEESEELEMLKRNEKNQLLLDANNSTPATTTATIATSTSTTTTTATTTATVATTTVANTNDDDGLTDDDHHSNNTNNNNTNSSPSLLNSAAEKMANNLLLTDEQKELRVKRNLLSFVLNGILLKKYKSYVLGFKDFVNQTFLNFRAAEETYISKLPYPIKPPSQVWEKLGVTRDSVDFLFLRAIAYEFISNEEQLEFDEFSKEKEMNSSSTTPIIVDSENPNKSLISRVSSTVSIVLNKKKKGFNWFNIYTKVRNQYLSFNEFLEDRRVSMDRMYQLTRSMYFPLSYLLILLSALLIFFKFAFIDYYLHGLEPGSLELPEFDYFWIICFAPLLIACALLTNIPLSVIFQLFKDLKTVREEFEIRDRYFNHSRNLQFFQRIKKHTYIGEILRRILIHVGVLFTIIGISLTLILYCFRMVLPLARNYYAFGKYEFASVYEVRALLADGFFVFSPLLIFSPFISLTYFLLSNRVLLHYIFVSHRKHIYSMTFIYILYTGIFSISFAVVALDLYLRFMSVGFLLLLMICTINLFSLSIELKNHIQKSDKKDKWVVVDGVFTLFFLFSIIVFLVDMSIITYAEMTILSAGLITSIPLALGVSLLSVSIVFALINGRKSLLGRLIRTSFFYTATSLSISSDKTQTATASLGRTKN